MHSPGDGTYINISSKQYFFIKGWVQDSIEEGGGVIPNCFKQQKNDYDIVMGITDRHSNCQNNNYDLFKGHNFPCT